MGGDERIKIGSAVKHDGGTNSSIRPAFEACPKQRALPRRHEVLHHELRALKQQTRRARGAGRALMVIDDAWAKIAAHIEVDRVDARHGDGARFHKGNAPPDLESEFLPCARPTSRHLRTVPIPSPDSRPRN